MYYTHTDLKDNHEYTAQISPRSGKVYAEIIYRDKNKSFDRKIDLWHSCMNKSFGRTFASEPREKDWLAAKAWVDEQLSMIRKHATVMVTEPVYLKKYVVVN